ncbi:MAG: EamA family transporter [Chloroflexi bacterium]|nr:EamA family transporter [Chloroflexota bacterium]
MIASAASPLLAALLALAAAAAWGSGDFTSGMAARRVGPFHTVFIAYLPGLVVLAAAALARSEAFSSTADLLWGALAGLAGMAGLGFLMRGFSTGRMGVVAPVSAVLATAIPVIFSAFFEGLPGGLQLGGFALALASIWLLSRPEPLGGRPKGLGMALLAGLGFGLFFILLGQISEDAVFWPLVSGRISACVLMTVYALSRRTALVPQNAPLGLLVLAGVLDAGGNLFFLLAVQMGRLDVTAVLASLYPAVTAVLAGLVARESLQRLQVIGVGAAVLAIVLITI